MKFFMRLFVSFNVFVFMNISASGVPVLRDSMTNQKYLNSLNQQNINAILTSIDIRLQNLDQFCSLQSATLQSKLAFYERKLDKMEKEILRIEMRIKTDLDKVSENISNKNFKDDMVADRIIKKVDSAFDRVTNKYAIIESNIDLLTTKVQNTRDVVIAKLDKIDESLYIRDEESAAEMEDAIEDLKKVCSSVEDNLLNKTQDYLKSLPNSNIQNVKLLYENSSLGNESLSNCSGIEIALDRNKADIESSINDFTNKVTDMQYNLDEALDNFKESLENAVLVINETRKDQQNNFKELRVGRKNSNNYLPDNQKLTEISSKIDKHFKRLISAQDSFSENCYKLQMDESQIETKISFVLEKIIENFENKTTLKPEDLMKLEKSLFVHDMYIRRHFYELVKKINMLSKKLSVDRISAEYTLKQFIHEKHEILERTLQNLEKKINADFLRNKTLENTLLMVNANLKNILKFFNNKTSSNWVEIESVKINSTDSKNNTDSSENYSTTETYIKELHFNYSTEETTFPEINFPIDIRFGTDDVDVSINSNVTSENYNTTKHTEKNNTDVQKNNTFTVDLELHSTEDPNLNESKKKINNERTVNIFLDWPTKPDPDENVTESQIQNIVMNNNLNISVDGNVETINGSDYDLEIAESTLNNKDQTERPEIDNENQDSVDVLEIISEWLGEDSR